MFGLSYAEIALVLLLVLLLFGSKKLPELAHGIGRSLREFRRGMNEAAGEGAKGGAGGDTTAPQPPPPAQRQAKPGGGSPPEA